MAAPEVLELTVIRGLEPSRLADHHAPLQTAGAVIADTEAPADRAIDALPPVDTGRDAWLFLVAAFVIETTVWGLPFSVVRSLIEPLVTLLSKWRRVSCISIGLPSFSRIGMRRQRWRWLRRCRFELPFSMYASQSFIVFKTGLMYCAAVFVCPYASPLFLFATD
jgi:hypothetical protein